MMEIGGLREPIEIFEAAAGNPEPLAQRIEAGTPLTSVDRIALAALLRGELVPPKRRRGQRTPPHLAEGTWEAW